MAAPPPAPPPPPGLVTARGCVATKRARAELVAAGAGAAAGCGGAAPRHDDDASSHHHHHTAVLVAVDDFAARFAAAHPGRPLPLLAPYNEAGVRRFVCGALRRTPPPTPALHDARAIAAFVAGALDHEPPASADDGPPTHLRSAAATLAGGAGDSFDASVLLASLLCGAGYDAYVVAGTAPAWLVLGTWAVDGATCPYVPPADAVDLQGGVLEREVAGWQEVRPTATPPSREAQPPPPPAPHPRDCRPMAHAWVLLRPGPRGVVRCAFVEPTTGVLFAACDADASAAGAVEPLQPPPPAGAGGGGTGGADTLTHHHHLPRSPYLRVDSVWNERQVHVCVAGHPSSFFPSARPRGGAHAPLTAALTAQHDGGADEAAHDGSVAADDGGGVSGWWGDTRGFQGLGGATPAERAPYATQLALAAIVRGGDSGVADASVAALLADGAPALTGPGADAALRLVAEGVRDALRGAPPSWPTARSSDVIDGDAGAASFRPSAVSPRASGVPEGGDATPGGEPYQPQPQQVPPPIHPAGVQAELVGVHTSKQLAPAAVGSLPWTDWSDARAWEVVLPPPPPVPQLPGQLQLLQQQHGGLDGHHLAGSPARSASASTPYALGGGSGAGGSGGSASPATHFARSPLDTPASGGGGCSGCGGGGSGGPSAGRDRRPSLPATGTTPGTPGGQTLFFGGGASGGGIRAPPSHRSRSGSMSVAGDAAARLRGALAGGAGAVHSVVAPPLPFAATKWAAALAASPALFPPDPAAPLPPPALDVPRCWSPPVVLNAAAMRRRLGAGMERREEYRRASLQRMLPRSHPDGVVARLTHFSDDDKTLPVSITEDFAHRRDGLYKRLRVCVGRGGGGEGAASGRHASPAVEEHFAAAACRPGGLAVAVEVLGVSQALHFHAGARVDGLRRRVHTFGVKIVETYAPPPPLRPPAGVGGDGNDDALGRVWHRSLTLAPAQPDAVPAIGGCVAPLGGLATMPLGGTTRYAAPAHNPLPASPPQLELTPDRTVPLHKMSERFLPPSPRSAPAPSGDADAAGHATSACYAWGVARVVYNLDAGTITVAYHPGPGRLLRDVRRFTKGSPGVDAEVLCEDPASRRPTHAELEAELAWLLRAERECHARARGTARAVYELLAARSAEGGLARAALIETPHALAEARAEAGTPLDEGDGAQDAAGTLASHSSPGADYLAPFLAAAKLVAPPAPTPGTALPPGFEPLCERDARRVDKDVRAAYKERLLGRVSRIQRALDAEHAGLARRHAAFARSREHAPEAAADYAAYCAQAGLRTRVLEARLARQAAVAAARYEEVEGKLAAEPRLRLIYPAGGEGGAPAAGEGRGGSGAGIRVAPVATARPPRRLAMAVAAVRRRGGG